MMHHPVHLSQQLLIGLSRAIGLGLCVRGRVGSRLAGLGQSSRRRLRLASHQVALHAGQRRIERGILGGAGGGCDDASVVGRTLGRVAQSGERALQPVEQDG